MTSNRWIYGFPLICLLLLLAAGFLARKSTPSRPEPAPPKNLSVLCTPELKRPVSHIAEAFQRRFGVRVDIFNDSIERLADYIGQTGKGGILLSLNTSDNDAIRNRTPLDDIYPIKISALGRQPVVLETIVLPSTEDPELAQAFQQFLEGPAARQAFERFPPDPLAE